MKNSTLAASGRLGQPAGGEQAQHLGKRVALGQALDRLAADPQLAPLAVHVGQHGVGHRRPGKLRLALDVFAIGGVE